MAKKKRSAARAYWRGFSPVRNLKRLLSNIPSNIRAAIVIAFYVLPTALVLSLLLGAGSPGNILGTQAALRAAIVVMFLTALLGGTAATLSGPTLIMTLAASVVIAQEQDPRQIALIFALAALLQMALGLSKRARFMTYIPQPVVSGFSNACAAAVILFAVNLILGHAPFDKDAPFFPAFPAVGQADALFRSANVYCLAAGAATVILGYLFSHVTRVIPGVLIALVLVCAGIYGINTFGEVTLTDFGGTLLEVKEGFFAFTAPGIGPDMSLLSALLPAIVIALLAASQNLSNADTYDNLVRGLHNSNRELWGLGIANMVGAFCGAIPGAGMVRPTTASFRYGGSSPLAGALAAILVGVAVAFGAPHLHRVPLAPLGGALLLLGLRMVDLTAIKRIRRQRLADVLPMVIVLAAGLFMSFYVTCIVAFLVSVVMLLDRIAIFLSNRLISLQDRKNPWRGEGALEKDLAQFCLIYRIDRPLAVSFLGDFWRAVSPLARPKAVFIRMNAVPTLDESAKLDLLYHVDRLRNNSVRVYLTGVSENLRKELVKADIVERLGEEAVTQAFSGAVAQCKKDLAADPEVRLYEMAAEEMGGSIRAVQVWEALQRHIRRDASLSVVGLLGVLALVTAGFAALAAVGWFLAQTIVHWRFMGATISGKTWLIVSVCVFAALVVVSVVRAWRQRALLQNPGFYAGHEGWHLVSARSFAGCLMVVPNLLSTAVMEIIEFNSRRFAKPTVRIAAMLLAKMPEKTSWEMLFASMAGTTEYDMRMALAGLRALNFVFFSPNKEDFDIELTDEGKKFVKAVEEELAPPPEGGEEA